MSRNLLSEISELKVYSKIGTFVDNDVVTISIYASGIVEPVDTDVCVQIGTTGVFYFDLGNITTPPTELTEYYWIMEDETVKVDSGLIRFGGWVESLPLALTPANMCRITTTLSNVDGLCTPAPNAISDPSKKNEFILKDAFYDGSRYFELGSYKPSYDELTGVAYWLIPRLATIDVFVVSFGISKKAALVPDVATIDLKTWLDSL